jgi:hypothetical protein
MKAPTVGEIQYTLLVAGLDHHRVTKGDYDEVVVEHVRDPLHVFNPAHYALEAAIDNDRHVTGFARCLTDAGYRVEPVTYPATEKYLTHYLKVRLPRRD